MPGKWYFLLLVIATARFAIPPKKFQESGKYYNLWPMKNLIIMLLLLVTIIACNKNQSKFGQIKPGMKSKAVIELVGDPKTKTPMFTVEWWSYPSDNKMIVMSGDTVERVVMDLKATQDSMKMLGAGLQQVADSLKKTMAQADSIK